MQKECCCPHGSWPILTSDYKPKGEKFQVAKTTCYHTGEGNKVLILVSDIFGATSSNHQSFADTWASLGYNVYLPEILLEPYSGDVNMEKIVASIKNQSFETMKQRFEGLLKYLEEKGHKRVFLIGFCWGLWFAFKMAAEFDNIIAIGGMHPSLGVQKMFGSDQKVLAQQIKAPAFFFPAGNDPENVKTNGEIVNILSEKFGADKVGTYEFPEMIHGWTVRGDVKQQNVKRDVQKAIHLCRDYFAKFD